jgi:hypothetical protein
MHLILTENEVGENDQTLNRYENIFCPMDRLEKKKFVEKWKSIGSRYENKYSVGRVFTNKETNVIKRLQAYNIMGSAFTTNSADSKTYLYMTCITKVNILILLEIVMIKTNNLYMEVKYKSESLQREEDLEKFLTLIISDVTQNETEELIGR